MFSYNLQSGYKTTNFDFSNLIHYAARKRSALSISGNY
jgi:hypothetical protein